MKKKEYANGWEFDKISKAFNKKNNLILWNGVIKYTLFYESRRHWQTPELEGYRIVCNRSVWDDKGGVLISHGLGKYITIVEEAGNRRSLKKIEDLTKVLTAEMLEDAFKGVKFFTAGGVVLPD